MTIQEFIDENREELDGCIDRAIGHVPRTATCYCYKSGTDHFHQPDSRDDEERRLWIENDESLYNWASDYGVFNDEEEED